MTLLELIDRIHARWTAWLQRPRSAELVQHHQIFRLAAMLVGAIVVIGAAPVIMTGLIGKTIPDGLIATSDKTVTGLIGVLGTIAGLSIRRTGQSDSAGK